MTPLNIKFITPAGFSPHPPGPKSWINACEQVVEQDDQVVEQDKHVAEQDEHIIEHDEQDIEHNKKEHEVKA